MGQEQSEFLFNIQATTSGIEDAVRKVELLKKSIADADAMSKRTILGPTGTPANMYIAERTPAIQRTAEQNVLMQSQAASRAMSQLYVPPDFGGQRVRYDIPKQQQQLLDYQNANQLLLTHQTQKTQKVSPNLFGNQPQLDKVIPTNYDVTQVQKFNTVYDILSRRVASGAESFASANIQLQRFHKIMAGEITQKTTYTPPGYNTEKLEKAAEAYKNLNYQVKNGSLNHSQYNNELAKLNKTMGTNYKSIENSTLAMMKLAARAVLVIPIWMAMRTAWMVLINAIGQGIQFWKEYETQLTEVGIASNATKAQLTILGESILTFSTIYGISASKALEAAKIFAQQGLTIKETIDMTRVAMIGSQVLGEDVTTVAESLTAAIRSYNIPMQESLTIVDKWMNVQKEFAITSKDLAEGMKTAGATASAFGISVDEFNGHMTAMIEVTRKSGSEAGNALQMIYTRLLTTARPAIQTIANVPVFQDKTGKAVMETTNIFRNANDVLDDLATAWVGLSEAEKIELATQVGSRRQATPFIALMENYNRGLLAQITSLTAAGTALKAYEQKQGTVAVRTLQMQNAWLQLSQTISQTKPWAILLDWIGNVADGLTGLINKKAALQKMMLGNIIEDVTKLDIEDARAKSYNKLLELEKEFSQVGKDPIFLDKIKKSLAELSATPIRPIELRVVDREVLDARQQLVDLKAELEAIEWDKSTFKSSKFSIFPPKELQSRFQKLLGKENKIYLEIETRTKTIKADKVVEEAEAKRKKDAEDLIKQNEAYNTQLDENEKQLVQRVTKRSSILKALGATEEQILLYQLQQYEAAKGTVDEEVRQLKVTGLRADAELEVLNRLKEQKDIMAGMFKTGFNNLFETGGGFGKAINEGLTKSYRDTVSTGLADMVNATGIGDIFGASIVNMQNIFTGFKDKIASSHLLGITKGSELIIRAHQIGMSTGAMKLQGDLAYGMSGGRIGPPTQNAFNTLSQTGIAGWSGSQATQYTGGNFSPFTYVSDYGTSKGYGIGSTSNYGVTGGRIGPPRKPQTGFRGNVVGAIGQSAMTGYSAYQSARAGGVSQGQSIASGVLTGASGLAIAGGALGMAAGQFGLAMGSGMGLMGSVGVGLAAIPIAGWIALGIGAIGVALGMFGGKRSKQESSQTSTTENRVASKIDISNKNLEIINRNLLGLKSAIETYMLPSSAYFAEKRGLEDNFSLHMRRGLN